MGQKHLSTLTEAQAYSAVYSELWGAAIAKPAHIVTSCLYDSKSIDYILFFLQQNE